MDLKTFNQINSPAGSDVIQAAMALSPRETDFLLHFQSLSRHYPAELARAALETAILRLEARSKFPFAEKLFLTRQALEQASSYDVSSYRVNRFLSFPAIADLGCSIGGDTFALANIAPTLGVELDSLRLAMASANLRSLGLSNPVRFIQADITHSIPVKPGSTALFFDPARRIGHKRFFTVENYQPPLSIIIKWLDDFPALGVKISPGVKLSELAGYDAEIEFISLRGDLKEAVLWFGPLKASMRSATVLPGSFRLVSEHPYRTSEKSIPITDPKSFLYEPDPAVIRAGLVTDLAEMLEASQLDAEIAYLTSDRLSNTPFAHRWSIEDWFPFQLKRLRAYLRQRNIGHVDVKKRGSPLEPEFLIHQLHLKGNRECILVLTHLRGDPIVLVCNAL